MTQSISSISFGCITRQEADKILRESKVSSANTVPWKNAQFILRRRIRKRKVQLHSTPSSGIPTHTPSTPVTTSSNTLSLSPSPSPSLSSATKSHPKSWADLLRDSNPVQKSSPQRTISKNGNLDGKRKTLGDIVTSYKSSLTMPILQPRGLVNNGNMCFMNAILQILVFCPPFYNLLELIGKNVALSFKRETPLMDALIIFSREFKVLQPNETEQWEDVFGDPLVPDYVYAALKGRKRFDNMRKGRQEDAEEFLGFLLDELHEEFLAEIRRDNMDKGNPAEDNNAVETGWIEVGKNNRTAFTRTTEIIGSPISTIFGGKLRSVLRCPGAKDSVTLEPYQPLQLDIQPTHVRTIEDALLNFVAPETLSDIRSPIKNAYVEATKQVFIETLPPILILHLKRFIYDNVGGEQKCHKIIGYGTELVIPPEVLSAARRPSNGSQIKYRLISVVYHHGASALGGHYTVDVLRHDDGLNNKDARNSMAHWINIDDTFIAPILEQDVRVKVTETSKVNGDVSLIKKDGQSNQVNAYNLLSLNVPTPSIPTTWAKKAAEVPSKVKMNGNIPNLHHLDTDRCAYILVFARVE